MKLLRSRYTKKIIFLLFILSILAVFAYDGLFDRSKKPSLDIKPIAVMVKKAMAQDIPLTLSALGTLLAPQNVTLMARQAGQITQMNFVSGQKVSKGAVLFVIDDAAEKAQLAIDQAKLWQAKLDYQRYQKLDKSPEHIVSQSTLDKYQSAYQQAKATVDMDEKSLADTQVIAPFSGYVSAPKTVTNSDGSVTQMAVGSYVNVGQALVNLVNRSQLVVQYTLPEEELAITRVGQMIHFTTRSAPGKTFHGKISYVSPSVNSSTHTFTVHATVTTKTEQLSPGIQVSVKQIISEKHQAIVIPAISLLPSLDGYHVYIVKKGKALLRTVEVNEMLGNQAVISSGLKAGEAVISAGNPAIHDGSTVQVVTKL